MNELNKNSSREEIQAYIDSIMQRDKHTINRGDENKNNSIEQLKNEITSEAKQKTENIDNRIVEFDKLKTKVLKYITYKKRTEKEVRQKFSSSDIDKNLLEDVIENLKENGYLNDESYIERAVNEYLAINTLSLKEIRNKLYAKGISSDIIEIYFSHHEEELDEYEKKCARKIVIKKQAQMEKKDIENFLYRKGYSRESVREAFE